jgi:hypothetical protein
MTLEGKGVFKGFWVGFDQGLTKVDQKGSLGVVGEVFEVMAQVDRRLTKVNAVDRFIRVNQPVWKPGASQHPPTPCRRLPSTDAAPLPGKFSPLFF